MKNNKKHFKGMKINGWNLGFAIFFWILSILFLVILIILVINGAHSLNIWDFIQSLFGFVCAIVNTGFAFEEVWE